MHKLASVLFHVDAGEADALVLTVHGDLDIAVLSDRQIVLGDLVGLGEVRVEIILAVELAELRNRAVGGQPGLDGVFQHLFVQDRQRPRQAEADWANVAVWRAAKGRGAVAEDFRIGF